jgi:hypothetical protein
MAARIVLDYHLEQYQTLGNTLTDLPFDNMSFLQEKEPIYNMAGQKVSKSYHDKSNREVVRITYDRVIGDFIYDGVTYLDIFLGLQKKVHYLDWAGEIANTKVKQFYSFNLEPVFVGDGSETIIGFSSQKQRQILKTERYNADDYLQAKNPPLYALLYGRYGAEYEYYLKTGIKTTFVNAINAEVDSSVNAALNNIVYGTESLTVKQLIIMNLQ